MTEWRLVNAGKSPDNLPDDSVAKAALLLLSKFLNFFSKFFAPHKTFDFG